MRYRRPGGWRERVLNKCGRKSAGLCMHFLWVKRVDSKRRNLAWNTARMKCQLSAGQVMGFLHQMCLFFWVGLPGLDVAKAIVSSWWSVVRNKKSRGFCRVTLPRCVIFLKIAPSEMQRPESYDRHLNVRERNRGGCGQQKKRGPQGIQNRKAAVTRNHSK